MNFSKSFPFFLPIIFFLLLIPLWQNLSFSITCGIYTWKNIYLRIIFLMTFGIKKILWIFVAKNYSSNEKTKKKTLTSYTPHNFKSADNRFFPNGKYGWTKDERRNVFCRKIINKVYTQSVCYVRVKIIKTKFLDS